MSVTPYAQVATTLEAPQPERRLHPRYPITLPVEYRLFNIVRTKQHGFGTTLNVSSSGVLIEAEDALPSDSPIEVLMDWPVLLNGVRPLKLRLRGNVVRRNGKFAAVAILRHEFRTARSNVAQ